MAATKRSQAQGAAKKKAPAKKPAAKKASSRPKKVSAPTPGVKFVGLAQLIVHVNDTETVVYQGEPNAYAQPHDDVRIELKVG